MPIAEEAGPDLTNESWVAALARVSDLSVPGYGFASIRSGKIDANDQQHQVEYDYDTKAKYVTPSCEDDPTFGFPPSRFMYEVWHL